MKADDDTYVIIENLRYMLQKHKPSDPVYFGFKMKPIVDQGYMSGGAGNSIICYHILSMDKQYISVVFVDQWSFDLISFFLPRLCS